MTNLKEKMSKKPEIGWYGALLLLKIIEMDRVFFIGTLAYNIRGCNVKGYPFLSPPSSPPPCNMHTYRGM